MQIEPKSFVKGVGLGLLMLLIVDILFLIWMLIDNSSKDPMFVIAYTIYWLYRFGIIIVHLRIRQKILNDEN